MQGVPCSSEYQLTWDLGRLLGRGRTAGASIPLPVRDGPRHSVQDSCKTGEGRQQRHGPAALRKGTSAQEPMNRGISWADLRRKAQEQK